MNKFIKQRNFEMAFSIGNDIIQTLLNDFHYNFCKEFPELCSNFNNIDELITYLYSNNLFPLKLAELDYYLGPIEIIIQTEGKSDQNYNVEKLYNHNSEFIRKMRNFLEGNGT